MDVAESLCRSNIERFRSQLRASSDQKRRAVLNDLLAREEERLQEILAADERPGASQKWSR